jgi:hypothetical protein
MPELINCPKCGGEVPDDLKICFLCGHVLLESEASRNFVKGDPIPLETELKPEMGSAGSDWEKIALVFIFLILVIATFFFIVTNRASLSNVMSSGIHPVILVLVISIVLLIPIWAFLRQYRRVDFWLRHGGKEEIRAKKENLQENARSSAAGAADRIAETAATSKQIGKGAGVFAKTVASSAADNLKGYAEGQNRQDSPNSDGPSERLRTIDSLLEAGQITEEEYAEKRADILSQI